MEIGMENKKEKKDLELSMAVVDCFGDKGIHEKDLFRLIDFILAREEQAKKDAVIEACDAINKAGYPGDRTTDDIRLDRMIDKISELKQAQDK